VRRVLEALGLKVNRLIRLSYGPFALGTLGVGEVEEVGPRVIREQLAGLIPPENMPKGDRPQYRAPHRKSRRAQAESRETELVPPPKEKAKKEYKAGWAKPKAKPRPHAKKPPKALLQAKIEGKTIGAPPKPPAEGRAAPARGPARPSGRSLAAPTARPEGKPMRLGPGGGGRGPTRPGPGRPSGGRPGPKRRG